MDGHFIFLDVGSRNERQGDRRGLCKMSRVNYIKRFGGWTIMCSNDVCVHRGLVTKSRRDRNEDLIHSLAKAELD